MTIRGSTIVFLCLLLVGCHRYVPTRLGSVPSGAEVRLQLSDEGTRRLEALSGSDAEEVEGRLLSWADEVILSVPLPSVPRMVDRDLRRRIVVASDDVVGIQVREWDRTRTALLVGGVATVVTTALVAALSGSFGGTGGPDRPPMEEEGSLLPVGFRVFP
ncbi:MAG: hypothetical protein U5R14_04545 [Gemmatimonadota bacterium]|nr:hypothetical protein [Gemmatimonadota bacterium]